MTQFQEYLFGIPVSTHRSRESYDLINASADSNLNIDNNPNDDIFAPFPYEFTIAATAIFFFRTAIFSRKHDSPVLRYFFGILLAGLAYQRKPYSLIFAVEIFSYCVPFWLLTPTQDMPLGLKGLFEKQNQQLMRLGLVFLSAGLSFGLCHLISNGSLFAVLTMTTPAFIKQFIASGLPIKEINAAYDVLDKFIYEKGLLRAQVMSLFFTTFHIQCGIGYLGIDFLKNEQARRNQLVRMDVIDDDDEKEDSQTNGYSSSSSSKSSSKDNKTDDTKAVQQKQEKKDRIKMRKSKSFQRSAGPFILLTAVPYMAQIIFYGNLNRFAFCCFKDDVHRAIRNYDLFENDNNLVALAEHSAKSPEAFSGYMDVIVDTTYDLFNRKLFSLPKVLLLPMIMARQPKMMIQIFPIIFATDWLKGRAIAYMTNRIEQLEKQTQEIIATRSKVESFDMKNAELLQRAGKYYTRIESIKSSQSSCLTEGPAHIPTICFVLFLFYRSRCDRIYKTAMGRIDSSSSNEDGGERFDTAHKDVFRLD